jgi:hypothetical protein
MECLTVIVIVLLAMHPASRHPGMAGLAPSTAASRHLMNVTIQ